MNWRAGVSKGLRIAAWPFAMVARGLLWCAARVMGVG